MLMKTQKYLKNIICYKSGFIKTFNTTADVTLHFQMSRLTLKKASDTNIVQNGYKWKINQY